ncbi:MAG: hypothetical protein MAG451_00276 [Anaerolineales bacterium]|nr:hypothetical protein [Anaerolineales bacterium]
MKANVAQITIYCNYSDLLGEEEAERRITEIADYVPAYRAIVEALRQDEPLTVSIEREARVCEAWLKRMAEQRGERCFEFVDVTPRSRLAEQWNVEVPAWVSDRAIRRAGLLDEAVSARPGEGFDDVVLRRFYSSHLTHSRLPMTWLVELLEDLDEQRPWDTGREPRLLRQVYRRRMGHWMEAAKSDGERLLVRLLQDDADQLQSVLAQFKVLRGYPSKVGQRVMGADFAHLRPLDLNLAGLRLSNADLRPAVDQITVYLNQARQQEASVALVETLLEQVSGELKAEFETLYELVTEREIAIERPLVNRVRERFAAIRAHIVDQIENLALYVPPEHPEAPDPKEDWDVSQWLQWAVDEYLPYRFWLEETEGRDEKIERYAAAYADWLYDHYPELRANFQQVVYRTLHNQMTYLESEGPALFIAIDNFNYKFLDHLERLLEDAGFYCSEQPPYLAMLPTCTEVSKKCLFTGSPEPFEETGYERPIHDAWHRQRGWTASVGDRGLRYLPYLGALKEIKDREHDVYFLNHTLIDEVLHKSEKELGISHAKAVRRRLGDLVGAVEEFARRIGAERELTVIVCSDHGSTRIPTEAVNLVDQAFYRERLDDPHHRYIAVSDDDMEALPDNVDFECYRFRRKVFGLNTNYVVVRGYSRFKDTDEASYVHGGLTPEETIVPLSVFQPVVEAPKLLTARLLEDEFRYGAKATIHLELVNVNSYPCLDLRIEVLDENVDYEPAKLEALGGHEDIELNIPVRIWRRDEDVTDLRLQISYQCLGERKRQVEVLAITMRSMMETDFDLEELNGAL